MKGLELPTNTMIVIILALLVLVALIMFFMGTFNPVKEGMSVSSVKSSACQLWTSTGCIGEAASIKTSDYDSNGDGTQGNDYLQDLCDNYYSCNRDNQCCKDVCGCPE